MLARACLAETFSGGRGPLLAVVSPRAAADRGARSARKDARRAARVAAPRAAPRRNRRRAQTPRETCPEQAGKTCFRTPVERAPRDKQTPSARACPAHHPDPSSPYTSWTSHVASWQMLYGTRGSACCRLHVSALDAATRRWGWTSVMSSPIASVVGVQPCYMLWMARSPLPKAKTQNRFAGRRNRIVLLYSKSSSRYVVPKL